MNKTAIAEIIQIHSPIELAEVNYRNTGGDLPDWEIRDLTGFNGGEDMVEWINDDDDYGIDDDEVIADIAEVDAHDSDF